MLTKKNLWFITLFSLILVMSIYYVSVPNISATELVSKVEDNKEDVELTISESSEITALKVSRDETMLKETEAIKDILSSDTTSVEDKNTAYEALKNINSNKGKEENIEKLIKDNYNLDAFVKIDGTNVKVVMDTNTHSYELANKIINTIQNEFKDKIYVTITFSAK